MDSVMAELHACMQKLTASQQEVAHANNCGQVNHIYFLCVLSSQNLPAPLTHNKLVPWLSLAYIAYISLLFYLFA